MGCPKKKKNSKRRRTIFLLWALQLFINFGLLSDPLPFFPTFSFFYIIFVAFKSLLYITMPLEFTSSSQSKCCGWLFIARLIDYGMSFRLLLLSDVAFLIASARHYSAACAKLYHTKPTVIRCCISSSIAGSKFVIHKQCKETTPRAWKNQ